MFLGGGKATLSQKEGEMTLLDEQDNCETKIRHKMDNMIRPP